MGNNLIDIDLETGLVAVNVHRLGGKDAANVLESAEKAIRQHKEVCSWREIDARLELRRGEMRQLRKQLKRAKKQAGVWKRKYRELAQLVGYKEEDLPHIKSSLREYAILDWLKDEHDREVIYSFLGMINEGGVRHAYAVKVDPSLVSAARLNLILALPNRPRGWEYAEVSIPRKYSGHKEVWVSCADFEKRDLITFNFHLHAAAFLRGEDV